MLYVLTAEEVEAIENKAKVKNDEARCALQKLCIDAANWIPVTVDYDGNKIENPKPWRCSLTVSSATSISGSARYCDSCPARDVCPYEYKNFSK